MGLSTYYVDIDTGGFSVNVDLSVLWTRKDKKTGKTAWDELKELATKGWELVSVTPIVTSISSGYTKYLLYTFKRPKE